MYALRERRVHVNQEDFEMAVAKVCLTVSRTLAQKSTLQDSLSHPGLCPDLLVSKCKHGLPVK